MIKPPILSLSLFFFLSIPISFPTDTLTPSHPLSHTETLISANKTFALGFFSPPNTTNRYIGIWYYNNTAIPSILWVANRRNPIPNLNATLSLSPTTSSLLILTPGNLTPLWSSPSFPTSSPNPIAQLLDSGNLIIKPSPNSSSILWQSFDHPTDTMLPGMKIGPNLKTGVDRNLTSWLSPSDPSPGRYAYTIDPIGVPQMVARVDSHNWYWRGGPWNGFGFSGASPNQDFTVEFDRSLLPSFNTTPDEIYYVFNVMGGALSILNIGQDGKVRRKVWLGSSQAMSGSWVAPRDECDRFALCGINSVCDFASSPICRCLDGFYPRDWVGWGRGDWAEGCERGFALNCAANGSDEFAVVHGVKLPDTREAVEDMSLDLDECRARCLMNCSCRAYANAYFTEGGIGCIVWMGEIRDVRLYRSGGQNLFVRVAGPREGKLFCWIFMHAYHT